MQLAEIQQLLERIYDLELTHSVDDYLVTDAALLAAMTSGNAGRDTDEKLIVVDADDGIDLALYIDPAVLARLAGATDADIPSADTLGDFLTALEGVSHFNYVAWNAAIDKPVTLLELEMQAEVDKYLAMRALLALQTDPVLSAGLLEHLFELPHLDPQLDDFERQRYRDAAHLAGRYCARLESTYGRGHLAPSLMREVRAFYRMPQGAKVSRIRSLHFA